MNPLRQAAPVCAILLICAPIYANSISTLALDDPDANKNTVMHKRIKKEDLIEPNPFAITFYKQNYILPLYYTGSPATKVYQNQISPGQRISQYEVKYQISLKVPIWKEILNTPASVYFAYTQLSYWQAYNKNAFFRETDFQPEFFISTPTNIPITKHWTISTLNVGAAHESNGFGQEQERSWNRIYVEAIASNNHWMLSVKPWYVFHDATYQKFNPDMANYLGYGELTVAYKYGKQVVTLQTHSLLEQGGRHATCTVTYSFPLTKHFNGFLQVFSGYGQSLIEYNHRTNSAGVGIALSNLI